MGPSECGHSRTTTFRVARPSRAQGICLPPDNGPGRETIYIGSLRPNLVEFISYDMTEFLQAESNIALACLADLKTSSAALRFLLHECGREQVFSLRPQVGEVLTLTPSITNKLSQTIHLMITRANQRSPLIADDFQLCLEKLVLCLGDRRVSNIYFPILDPERPVYSLANLHQIMMDLFAVTNIKVILLIRVYVSKLGIEVGNEPPIAFP